MSDSSPGCVGNLCKTMKQNIFTEHNSFTLPCSQSAFNKYGTRVDFKVFINLTIDAINVTSERLEELLIDELNVERQLTDIHAVKAFWRPYDYVLAWKKRNDTHFVPVYNKSVVIGKISLTLSINYVDYFKENQRLCLDPCMMVRIC